jgi:hypothetical protein
VKNLPEHVYLDVSSHPTRLVDGRLEPVGDALVEQAVRLVTGTDGVAVCRGVAGTLAHHGLDVRDEQAAAVARDYLESLFRAFTERIEVARFTPVAIDYDRVARMDVDGFNKNKHFTPNGDHTGEREFLTTKCVHFDSATPFVGNIYGPNTNITGGLPVVCDTRGYCRDHDVAPADLVELMPHSYNVAVRAEHTDAILDGYAGLVEADLDADLVLVILLNEVEGGLAHAGSAPRATDPEQPSKRPIRHVEYQFGDGAELTKWFTHYRLELPEVSLEVPDEAAQLRYHRGVEAVDIEAAGTEAGAR